MSQQLHNELEREQEERIEVGEKASVEVAVNLLDTVIQAQNDKDVQNYKNEMQQDKKSQGEQQSNQRSDRLQDERLNDQRSQDSKLYNQQSQDKQYQNQQGQAQHQGGAQHQEQQEKYKDQQDQHQQAQQSLEQNSNPLVLVVEDDRAMLMMLETRLIKKGYKVITAKDGRSAREQIEKNHLAIDAVLLDRVMPDIDGLEVVEWINTREDISKMPIIMQTGSDSPGQIKEGIDAGVFYYLTKPIQESVLSSVLHAAVKEARRTKLLRIEMERHKTSFSLIYNARFFLKTLEEAEDLSCFIANSFPEPAKIMPGIAELMINAVEHGKCKISYDEKTQLIDEDRWRSEVEHRCNLKENFDKVIEVIFQRQGDRCSLKISDKGDGFVWRKYMKVDPSRAMDNHGRGVARANMLFDKLAYNDVGNVVIAIVDPELRDNFEW